MHRNPDIHQNSPKNVKKSAAFCGREALTWVPLWCASNCCLTQLCARKSSERRPRRRQKHAQLSGRGLEWADTSSLGKWQELGWAKARMQGKDCQIYKSKARTESEAERRPALQTRSRMGRILSSPAGQSKAADEEKHWNPPLPPFDSILTNILHRSLALQAMAGDGMGKSWNAGSTITCPRDKV